MSYKELVNELRQPTRDLRDAIPETWAAFGKLHETAVADGVLSAKTKELIATAIAVTDGCDGCIAYHTRAAARLGVAEDEMAEALGVALLMKGGPASVYAPRAFAAFKEFKGS